MQQVPVIGLALPIIHQAFSARVTYFVKILIKKNFINVKQYSAFGQLRKSANFYVETDSQEKWITCYS